jgi:hypothetical protein
MKRNKTIQTCATRHVLILFHCCIDWFATIFWSSSSRSIDSPNKRKLRDHQILLQEQKDKYSNITNAHESASLLFSYSASPLCIWWP